MDEDVKRLLTIIKRAPSPFGKTDSELAQEYRNWYLGSRLNMKAAEQSFAPDVCHGTVDGRHLWQNDSNGRYCFACGARR